MKYSESPTINKPSTPPLGPTLVQYISYVFKTNTNTSTPRLVPVPMPVLVPVPVPVPASAPVPIQEVSPVPILVPVPVQVLQAHHMYGHRHAHKYAFLLLFTPLHLFGAPASMSAPRRRLTHTTISHKLRLSTTSCSPSS